MKPSKPSPIASVNMNLHSSQQDSIRKEQLSQLLAGKVIQGRGHFISPLAPRSFNYALTKVLPSVICDHFPPIKVVSGDLMARLHFLNVTIEPPSIRRKNGDWSYIREWEAVARSLTLLSEIRVTCVLYVYSKKAPVLLTPQQTEQLMQSLSSLWDDKKQHQSSLPVLPKKKKKITEVASYPSIAHSVFTAKELKILEEQGITDEDQQSELLFHQLDIALQKLQLAPEHFQRLQARYADCVTLCGMTEEEQKEFPFLLQEQYSPNALFCLVPCQNSGVTSETYDDFNLKNHCRYDQLHGFILNGVKRLIVAEDAIRWNYNFVRWRLDKKKIVTSEMRAEHLDAYRCSSTIHGQVNQGVVTYSLPWLEDETWVELPVIIRALGETDEPEQKITAELKFCARLYQTLLLRLRCMTHLDPSVLDESTNWKHLEHAFECLPMDHEKWGPVHSKPVVVEELFKAMNKLKQCKEPVTLREMMLLFRHSLPKDALVLEAIELTKQKEKWIRRNRKLYGCGKRYCLCPTLMEVYEKQRLRTYQHPHSDPTPNHTHAHAQPSHQDDWAKEERKLIEQECEKYLFGSSLHRKGKKKVSDKNTIVTSQHEALLLISLLIPDTSLVRKIITHGPQLKSSLSEPMTTSIPPTSTTTTSSSSLSKCTPSMLDRILEQAKRDYNEKRLELREFLETKKNIEETLESHPHGREADDDEEEEEEDGENSEQEQEQEEEVEEGEQESDRRRMYCPFYQKKKKSIQVAKRTLTKEVFPNITMSEKYRHEMAALEMKLASPSCSSSERIRLKRKIAKLEKHITEDKLQQLAHMVADMWLLHCGHTAETNKDTLVNKRITAPGKTLIVHMKQHIRSHLRTISNKLQRKLDEGIILTPRSLLHEDPVSNRLHTAFILGDFTEKSNGKKSDKDNKNTGHLQPRKLINPIAAFGQALRIVTRIHAKGKEKQARSVHDYLNTIDIHYSPDGKACGIVKNTTMNFQCSEEQDDHFLLQWIQKYGQLKPFNASLWITKTKAFLNASANTYQSVDLMHTNNLCVVVHNGGHPLGFTKRPQWFIRQIRMLRRKGILPPSVQIVREHSIIRLETDAGRALIELLNVRKFLYLNKTYGIETMLQMTDQDLRRLNVIETVDNAEMCTIATTVDECIARIKQGEPTLRYCMIHPSLIQSICSAINPCAQHNMGTRIAHTTSMCFQANAIGSFHFRRSFDTQETVFILASPQKPLISTAPMRWFHIHDTPLGGNKTSCVVSFQGGTQDDCIVMNLDALQRGSDATIACSTGVTEEKSNRIYHPTYQQFFYPDGSERFMNSRLLNAECMSTSTFAAIHENGLPMPGCRILPTDSVLFSKARPIQNLIAQIQENEVDIQNANHCLFSQFKNRSTHSDRSVLGEDRTCGVVDSTLLTLNGKMQRMVKSFLTTWKVSKQGEKLTSRHGQKGLIKEPVPQYMLPHNEHGSVPTYNINHAAFHSRMTIGQLVEMVLTQLMEATGEPMDGTLYSKLYKLADTHRKKYMHRSLLYEEQDEQGKKHNKQHKASNEFHLDMMDVDFDMSAPMFQSKEEYMDPLERENKINKVCRAIFEKLGYSIHALTPMYSGITGKRLGFANGGDGLINFNVVYTLSLNHRVDYKVTAVGNKKLGIRLGEMERDILIGHGVSRLANDRLHKNADACMNYICTKCGWDSVANEKEQTYYCVYCGPGSHIKRVAISKYFKTCLNMILMLNVIPIIHLEPLS